MKRDKEIDVYHALRKPATQFTALFTLVLIGFTSLTFVFGLDLKKTPIYLIVSTIVQFIVIILSFVPLYFKDKPSQFKLFIKRLSLFSIMCALSMYNATFAAYNVYFYLAAQNGIYLFDFWIIGTLAMIFSYFFQILQHILLLRDPEKFHGKTKEDRLVKKMVSVTICKVLSYIVIIQKIIEYFTIPNIQYSRFVIIVVTIVVFGAMVFSSTVLNQFVRAVLDFKLKK